MAYATLQDVLDLEGEDTLYAAADRDRDGTLNAAETLAVSDALDAGAAEMDSYIGQRFDLPLPSAPPWAKRLNIDIALYRLARSADALTNELRQRYEDAIAFLKNVATGRAGLALPAIDMPAGDDTGEIKGGDPLIQAAPRVFLRGARGGVG
ncbi:MAG: DUF1320 domain-containing protein [Sinobacteraceae bacterium]|nr:DUF1320 domain-containing protein [Nevskiaceae bacterium]